MVSIQEVVIIETVRKQALFTYQSLPTSNNEAGGLCRHPVVTNHTTPHIIGQPTQPTQTQL